MVSHEGYQSSWSVVLSLHMQSVDYKAMAQSSFFEQYCELAVQLQRVELGSLSREEKLAFFINVYNALVIHGNVRLGAPKNMWQRYRVRTGLIAHQSQAGRGKHIHNTPDVCLSLLTLFNNVFCEVVSLMSCSLAVL